MQPSPTHAPPPAHRKRPWPPPAEGGQRCYGWTTPAMVTFTSSRPIWRACRKEWKR